jgi:hypothetical protein
MLTAARVELLDPKPQKPSYRHLLHIAAGVVQNRLNRVQNTGRAWAVGEATLSVTSGTADYTVSANGLGTLGKVLDVTTYDPAGQNPEERQVAFHDLSDVADGWDEWGSGAARIAFYRKGGSSQLWARVRPVPTASADYRVCYSIGEWASNADLSTSPLLSQFHSLFVAEIAYAALPAAMWWEDEKENRNRRAELRGHLGERIAEQGKEFDRHIASLSAPRNTFRVEAFSIDG